MAIVVLALMPALRVLASNRDIPIGTIRMTACFIGVKSLSEHQATESRTCPASRTKHQPLHALLLVAIWSIIETFRQSDLVAIYQALVCGIHRVIRDVIPVAPFLAARIRRNVRLPGIEP